MCVECGGMLGWAGWWDDARVAGQWQSVVKAVASCMHTTRHLSHLCPHSGWPGLPPLHCSSSPATLMCLQQLTNEPVTTPTLAHVVVSWLPGMRFITLHTMLKCVVCVCVAMNLITKAVPVNFQGPLNVFVCLCCPYLLGRP